MGRVIAAPFQPPKHLSVSSVQQYERCPFAWHQKYILHRRLPMPDYVIFGSIMAKALEAYHLGRDAEVVFAKLHAEESERFRARGLPFGPDADYGMQLLHLYRDLPSYQGRPEWSFTLKLPAEFRVPVPCIGFADLRTAGGIVEFKTSRARWTQARADNEYQAALYAEAYRRDAGREPSEVRYVVMNTNWPDIAQFVTHPGRAQLERFGKAAGDMWRHIMARDFERRCGQCEFCVEAKAREPGEAA